MKVLYWNVYVGHNPDDAMEELRGLIKAHKPEVIGIGEAKRIYMRLDSIKGYRAYTLEELYEGRSDTAVLVRDDVDLRRWRWLEMTKWWTGPKHGKAQGPKRYWHGRIRHHGKTIRLSIGHWPFNTAVEETEERIVAWFNRAMPWTPAAHLGDLNMGPEESEKYVKRFKGKQTGHKVDRCLFKNLRVTFKELGMHGSDHAAVLFFLT